MHLAPYVQSAILISKVLSYLRSHQRETNPLGSAQTWVCRRIDVRDSINDEESLCLERLFKQVECKRVLRLLCELTDSGA
jgi:hypothetical protein